MNMSKRLVWEEIYNKIKNKAFIKDHNETVDWLYVGPK